MPFTEHMTTPFCLPMVFSTITFGFNILDANIEFPGKLILVPSLIFKIYSVDEIRLNLTKYSSFMPLKSFIVLFLLRKCHFLSIGKTLNFTLWLTASSSPSILVYFLENPLTSA